MQLLLTHRIREQARSHILIDGGTTLLGNVEDLLASYQWG
ncbi:hypothetical protein [Pseudomonas sp. 58 R 12]|nr:hypothetical protein [Pseudomonas sp. 58 R 12]